MKRFQLVSLLLFLTTSIAVAREYHVSVDGDDRNDGSAAKPFSTIGAAADVAKPGDVITVHEGTYRERIDPPRGGTSDDERIVYQAAPGEEVILKGSEPVEGWERVQNDTWKVTMPNTFFGDFNPYDDLISGDWFAPQGRNHHTGAVYLDGHWLTEAAALEDVLEPVKEIPIWAYQVESDYLMNVAWIQPGNFTETSRRVAATDYGKQRGVVNTGSSEEGDVIGYIRHGDFVQYGEVDFGQGAEEISIHASSATPGGDVEIRLGEPDGKLLKTLSIPDTGGWESWKTFTAEIPATSGMQTISLLFLAPDGEVTRNALYDPETRFSNPELWFSEVNETETTIWAQFKGIDPNEADVEINVRQTVFYPSRTGIDYLTVRGFTMMHAATPWAPPTAEQIGLIGTHWSKGWIIENNDISYSTSTGVTLGKHGDEWDNTSADTATGYVETIERAKAKGWSKENIGHHIVRNNRIAYCEQAGLVGSLGAIFSTISDNVIHDVHVRQLFSGQEMAGIKLHAPIDTLISGNHIYRTARGIWLDWMTQGTRVTRNLLHDNDVYEDLFIEVNHGPYVVDNNILLSRRTLYDNSQGGAYMHNLFAGDIFRSAEFNRDTPFHKAHSTEIVGLHNIQNGDNRFYNNIFSGSPGLASYDDAILPVQMGGNVFLHGAAPSKFEEEPLVLPDLDPGIELSQDDHRSFSMTVDPSMTSLETEWIGTEQLGETVISKLPFKNYDGADLKIDTDYFGEPRTQNRPTVGPFGDLNASERFSRNLRARDDSRN